MSLLHISKCQRCLSQNNEISPTYRVTQEYIDREECKAIYRRQRSNIYPRPAPGDENAAEVNEEKHKVSTTKKKGYPSPRAEGVICHGRESGCVVLVGWLSVSRGSP